MKPDGITVAIDGPAGAGKSTVAKEVADALGYVLVDTGAIYRCVTLLAMRRNIVWDDGKKLVPLIDTLNISFSLQDGVNRVFLDREDVTLAIRARDISQHVSAVSAFPEVRLALLDLQRQLAGQGGAVLEGRDIGTVVCPDAPVKFFLDASPQERARRRYEELVARGENVALEEVLEEIIARDALDRSRDHAPLKPAADAVLLDSTRLSVQEVIDTIVASVHAYLDKK